MICSGFLGLFELFELFELFGLDNEVQLTYYFPWGKGLKLYFEDEVVKFIAPDPISNTKPIVNTKKNRIAMEKPKKLM